MQHQPAFRMFCVSGFPVLASHIAMGPDVLSHAAHTILAFVLFFIDQKLRLWTECIINDAGELNGSKYIFYAWLILSAELIFNVIIPFLTISFALVWRADMHDHFWCEIHLYWTAKTKKQKTKNPEQIKLFWQQNKCMCPRAYWTDVLVCASSWN